MLQVNYNLAFLLFIYFYSNYYTKGYSLPDYEYFDNIVADTEEASGDVFEQPMQMLKQYQVVSNVPETEEVTDEDTPDGGSISNATQYDGLRLMSLTSGEPFKTTVIVVADVDFYLPARTLTEGENIYGVEPDSTGRNNTTRIDKDYEIKKPSSRSGFKTLWQPYYTNHTPTMRLAHTYIMPTRVFNWKLHPKVDIRELTTTTTEPITFVNTTDRNYANYFKLYYPRNSDTSNTSFPFRAYVPVNESSVMRSFNSKKQALRGHKLPETLFQYPRAHCYTCGLNISGVPVPPTCAQIFGDGYPEYKSLRANLKDDCSSIETTAGGWSGRRRRGVGWSDEAKSVDVSRPYRGGCFRRFVDVGDVHDQRGCRAFPPYFVEMSFNTKRYLTLETSLWHLDDGCIMTPLAILTPFNRAISLWARYHVCVCKGSYCNNAPKLYPNGLVTVVIKIILISAYNSWGILLE